MAKKDGELTPMMKQFFDLKSKHPEALLLFRCGDFYETYCDDAIDASRILGITLTKRNNGASQGDAMAGFPHHALDTYLPKLIRAGRRVAICDQLEDPKLTKKLVKRGITELVTPGVAIQDTVLNYKENNFLCAIHFGKSSFGISLLDISTGEFLCDQGNHEYIDKMLANFQPKEVLVDRNHKGQLMQMFGQGLCTYEMDDWVFSEQTANQKLHHHFKVRNMKGFGVENLKDGLIASGAVLQYLEMMQQTHIDHIIKLQSVSLFHQMGYPIDKANTLHITPYLRYNQKHVMSMNEASLLTPSQKSFWVGLKGDYVADFTKEIGFNARKGFRGKAFAEILLCPISDFHYLNVLGLDLRHYMPLPLHAVWANRVAVSSSFGRDHLIYYLGGVDKWLNASFNADNQIDTSFNYSYQTLATNLRGFPQNIRNGNSFFVWNTEIRLPIVQFFSTREQRSDFLKSLQLVGFTDVGTAWNDTHLYHRMLNTNFLEEMKKKERKGFVAGFGCGLRACLFDYHFRMDYAWGIEEGHFNSGFLYFSFNSDF